MITPCYCNPKIAGQYIRPGISRRIINDQKLLNRQIENDGSYLIRQFERVLNRLYVAGCQIVLNQFYHPKK